jgi:hypothetical protein
MRLQHINGYWTLILSNGKPLMTFATLTNAVDLVPEAEIVGAGSTSLVRTDDRPREGARFRPLAQFGASVRSSRTPL